MQLTHEVHTEVLAGMSIKKMSHTSSSRPGNVRWVSVLRHHWDRCVYLDTWCSSSWRGALAPLWVNPPHSEKAEREEKEKQENKSPQHASFQSHLRKRQFPWASMFAAAPRRAPAPSYTVKSQAGQESLWGLGCLWFYRLTGQAWPLGTMGGSHVIQRLLSWPCFVLSVRWHSLPGCGMDSP